LPLFAPPVAEFDVGGLFVFASRLGVTALVRLMAYVLSNIGTERASGAKQRRRRAVAGCFLFFKPILCCSRYDGVTDRCGTSICRWYTSINTYAEVCQLCDARLSPFADGDNGASSDNADKCRYSISGRGEQREPFMADAAG
jgi:hypothetical protein